MEKYRKYREIFIFASLIFIINIFYTKIDDEIQIDTLDLGQFHTHKDQKSTLLFRTEKCI